MTRLEQLKDSLQGLIVDRDDILASIQEYHGSTPRYLFNELRTANERIAVCLRKLADLDDGDETAEAELRYEGRRP